MQFAQDVLEVVFDRVLADDQAGANLFVRKAVGYQFEHFQLTNREFLSRLFGRIIRGGTTATELLQDSRRHASRDRRLTPSQAAKLLEQLRAANVLDQVALRSGLDG